jgi:hypothetical protein
MTKLTEVLKSIASQSGVSETELQSIMENSALASIEIDDAISTRLTVPRLTMESAKANPDLKKHFTAQALNGVDSEMQRLMNDMGVSAEIQTEINGLDTTFKRVPALMKKIQELESKKQGAGSEDVAKMNQKISDLNAELAKTNETFANERTQLKNGFEQERVDFEFNNILGAFNYALPKETPIEAVKMFGRTIAENGMREKGVKIVKENGSLVLKTSEGTDYFENNVKIGVNDFVQKTLANAKVLSVSGTQTPPATQVVQQHNSNPSVNASEFNSVIDKAIAGEL